MFSCFRHLFAAVALVAATGFMAGGCSWTPEGQIADNVENSKRLRVGMTKIQVLDIMGEPLTDEEYCTPNVWYYYIRVVWADGLRTEDECMPLVFRDGKLIGWGNEFYTDYRLKLKNETGAKNLEL
ncbi:MAG: DUF3192 domain-containing protein [Victivallaceae bacterium]|nr:DUF3192 domain-containing protein [Victivallaceae bacterium]